MNGGVEETACFDVSASDFEINCVARITEKEEIVDGVDA